MLSLYLFAFAAVTLAVPAPIEIDISIDTTPTPFEKADGEASLHAAKHSLKSQHVTDPGDLQYCWPPWPETHQLCGFEKPYLGIPPCCPGSGCQFIGKPPLMGCLPIDNEEKVTSLHAAKETKPHPPKSQHMTDSAELPYCWPSWMETHKLCGFEKPYLGIPPCCPGSGCQFIGKSLLMGCLPIDNEEKVTSLHAAKETKPHPPKSQYMTDSAELPYCWPPWMETHQLCGFQKPYLGIPHCCPGTQCQFLGETPTMGCLPINEELSEL